MKLLLLGVFVLAFAVLPMYLLDALVMPQLDSLKQVYAHAEDVANNAAGTSQYAQVSHPAR